jgi:hypothetical protein
LEYPNKASGPKVNLRAKLTKVDDASRPVRLAYQPPASSTFLSEQTSHQQPANSTLLSEQTSTSHQPPANRTGCLLGDKCQQRMSLHRDQSTVVWNLPEKKKW